MNYGIWSNYNLSPPRYLKNLVSRFSNYYMMFTTGTLKNPGEEIRWFEIVPDFSISQS